MKTFRLIRHDFKTGGIAWDVIWHSGNGKWMSLTDDLGFPEEEEAKRFLDRTLVNWDKPSVVTKTLEEVSF